MVFYLILYSFLIFLVICIVYCVYVCTIGFNIDRRRRTRASDISNFLNNEFRKLYYYEFGTQCYSRWQIGVLANDDGSWDFCNYFEDVYKNLIDEYKRLTKNCDGL